MAVTHETLRLAEALRVQVNHTVDKQTRDLVKAWVDAWDEVAPDLQAAVTDLIAATEDGKLTRRMLLRGSRLQKALAAIAEQLDALAKDTGVRIVGDLAGVVDYAGRTQASIIASQLPADITKGDLVGWDLIDKRQITAIVTRTTKRITSRTRPLSADAMRVVRRELVRGVAAGSSPRETARRIVARAEGGFNGGLTRALRISRTETLDAHREASRVSRIANTDVLVGWRWRCEFSTRTCPACIAMDGQLFPPEAPGPNDHVCGRCTGVPETKPWADLGFDQVEPSSVLGPPARDRFADMPVADQRTILGPSRYEAWQRGAYPVDKWAVTKSNTGWRDSIQVSRPPSGGRRSGRLAS